MGQHKLPPAARNGRGVPTPLPRRIRVVHDIRLENVDADRVTMLLIGEKAPELAAAMSPAESRKLAAALVAHAEAIEKAGGGSRIIIPGA